MSRDDLLKGLTKEQIEKARACESSEQLLALAKEEGIELTDEQLESISGGACTKELEPPTSCPDCGSSNIEVVYKANLKNSEDGYMCQCRDCQHRWLSF